MVILYAKADHHNKQQGTYDHSDKAKEELVKSFVEHNDYYNRFKKPETKKN